MYAQHAVPPEDSEARESLDDPGRADRRSRGHVRLLDRPSLQARRLLADAARGNAVPGRDRRGRLRWNVQKYIRDSFG